MLAKKIKFTDYNGVEREQTFLFNLSKAELAEMEYGIKGGLSSFIEKISNTNDVPELAKIFKDLLLKAYGIKSDDGLRFIKSEKLSKEFSETEAYSELYMELATDADAAIKFFEGIIPKIPEDKKTEYDQKIKELKDNYNVGQKE